MKYDQNKINEIAATCQKKNVITQELFDAVKKVAYVKLYRSFVPKKLYDGYICLCIADAFKYWDITKGATFTNYVYTMISNYILEYTRKDVHVVELPLTPDKVTFSDGTTMKDVREKHDEISTDSPIGDGTVTFLDTYGAVDEEYEYNLMDKFHEAVEELPNKYKKLYRWIYIDELTRTACAKNLGVSRETIRIRLNKITKILQKKMKKYKDQGL